MKKQNMSCDVNIIIYLNVGYDSIFFFKFLI